MVRVQGHSLVPLPKGPCPSFRIAPCVGSLLWKAKLFGFLVYSEVPQTSSSISEPVTNIYNEVEASSLTKRLSPWLFNSPAEQVDPAWSQSYLWKAELTNQQRWGRGCVAVEIDHSPGNCSLLRTQSEKLNNKFFTSRPCSRWWP